MTRNKKYTLVAWTEKGQVRMIPSLAVEFARPMADRINTLAQTWVDVLDEPRYIMELSRAHEALARFLESLGYTLPAFREWVAAADTCCCCDDFYWLDCDDGYILAKPFAGRFFAMYDECKRMLQEHPQLRKARCYDRIKADFNVVTLVSRIWDEQDRECMEKRRAWRFGKTA